MTDDRQAVGALQAFEAHLDRFGGDVARWPAAAAARYLPLVEADPAAARLLAEARALDRLLDRAPVPEAERREALAQRIVAAARADGVPQASIPTPRDRVVAFPGPKAKPARRPARRDWQAAGLLAASLLLGIFVGVNGTFDGAISGLTNLAGLSPEVDVMELAFEPSALTMFDEEAL
jgi:hypothetical protein